ncbi:MAG: RagB/SusD family nutrient uptake outer membrane protein, partial [Bacteroidales bacterium]|nr:RagB/SusD family nutrient uptake outer membrane protein [Bacteroidales bacterium]
VSEDKYPEGIYIGYEARNDFSTDDYSDPWGLYLVKWAGVRIKKYEYDPTTSGQNYFNADRVIFRYADMLLLAAEAQYRLGKKAEALALVNQVRARVGVDALTDITIKDILDEKLREEIWETMGRRGDQVRFGTYTEADEDKYQGVKHAIVASDWVYDATGYTTVFPIPVSVISLNSNLTQNPGY